MNDREELTAILAAHGDCYDSDCDFYSGCACGWNNGTDEDNKGYDDHLAEAVLPFINQVKTKSLRDAADEFRSFSKFPNGEFTQDCEFFAKRLDRFTDAIEKGTTP